ARRIEGIERRRLEACIRWNGSACGACAAHLKSYPSPALPSAFGAREGAVLRGRSGCSESRCCSESRFCPLPFAKRRGGPGRGAAAVAVAPLTPHSSLLTPHSSPLTTHH